MQQEQDSQRGYKTQLMQMGLQSGRDQAQNMLQAIQLGNQRQGMLSDIALRNLQQNQDFSKFLAQHGLDRARTMEDIRNGRIQNLLPLIQQYFGAAGQARAGAV